jgi:hypothetical protein
MCRATICRRPVAANLKLQVIPLRIEKERVGRSPSRRIVWPRWISLICVGTLKSEALSSSEKAVLASSLRTIEFEPAGRDVLTGCFQARGGSTAVFLGAVPHQASDIKYCHSLLNFPNIDWSLSAGRRGRARSPPASGYAHETRCWLSSRGIEWGVVYSRSDRAALMRSRNCTRITLPSTTREL